MPSKRKRKTKGATVLRHHVFGEVSVPAVHKLDGDRTALVVLDNDGVQRVLLVVPIYWATPTDELEKVIATLPTYAPKSTKVTAADALDEDTETITSDDQEQDGEPRHIDDIIEPEVGDTSEDGTEPAADNASDAENEEVTACDRD